MTKTTQKNHALIVQKQIDAFRSLMELALVSEAEFCTEFDIKVVRQLKQDKVDVAMYWLFLQGLKNHKLQGDNHG